MEIEERESKENNLEAILFNVRIYKLIIILFGYLSKLR